MRSERIIKTYTPNPKRDRQYDAALREHLAATWELPGRTASQIAHALGAGDAKNDKDYAMAIIWALADFVQNDDSTIMWYPNLRLPQGTLAMKRQKNKYDDYNRRLFKHSPWRKAIDRDPSRTDEVVQGVIRGYLVRFGPRSGSAIQKALKTKLGHIDKRLVERGIDALVEFGALIAEKTLVNNATLYSLAPRPASP